MPLVGRPRVELAHQLLARRLDERRRVVGVAAAPLELLEGAAVPQLRRLQPREEVELLLVDDVDLARRRLGGALLRLLRREIRELVDRMLLLVHLEGEAAQVLIGAVLTKIQPRRQGNKLSLDHMLTERRTVAAQGLHVGIQVERPLRGNRNRKAQFTHRRQQKVTAHLKGAAAQLADFPALLAEGRQCGLLRHVRRADVEVLRQFF